MRSKFRKDACVRNAHLSNDAPGRISCGSKYLIITLNDYEDFAITYLEYAKRWYLYSRNTIILLSINIDILIKANALYIFICIYFIFKAKIEDFLFSSFYFFFTR